MNNRQDNNIDRLFREKLSEARVSPSPRAWDGIAGGLDQEDRKRRRAAWIWWSAAASLLLLITAGAFVYFNQGSQKQTKGSMIAQNKAYPSIVEPRNQGPDQENISQDTKIDRSMVEREEIPATVESGRKYTPSATYHNSSTGGKQKLTSKSRAFKPSFAENVLKRENLEFPQNPILSKLGLPEVDPSGARLGRDGGYGLHELNFAEMESQQVPQDLEEAQDEELMPLIEEAFASNEEEAVEEEKEKKRKKRKNRWKMGGQFSPDYALASSAGPPGSASIFSDAANLNASLKREATPTYPNFAYTAGVNVGYEVSDRVDLQSGVLYASRLGNSQAVYAYQRSGAAFATTESVEANYNFSYLEVPLKVKYEVIQKERFNYYVSSGVSGNLFLDYKANLNSEFANQTLDLKGEAKTMQPSQLNVLVSTGVEYEMARDLSLNFEPTLRLNAVTSDYSFARNAPGSLSLNTGLNYRF